MDRDINLVQDLLRYSIDASIPSRQRGSAFHLVAFRGHAANVTQLLKYVADIEFNHKSATIGYLPHRKGSR